MIAYDVTRPNVCVVFDPNLPILIIHYRYCLFAAVITFLLWMPFIIVSTRRRVADVMNPNLYSSMEYPSPSKCNPQSYIYT